MTMLDGNSAAELARDRGEMPKLILAQARQELTDLAWDELNFITILDAISEICEKDKTDFVGETKYRKGAAGNGIFIIIDDAVSAYITPSETEISARAVEILAEMDDRKGVTI